VQARAPLGLILALLVGTGVPVPAAAELEILGPDAVRAQHMHSDGDASFLVIDGRRWELVTDPSSPLVSALGDGRFHPMDEGEVVRALESVPVSRHFDGRVLILPYPRRSPLRSSFENGAIVLSPGIRPVSAAHVHATVIHELGHLVQRERAPEGSRAFEEYRALRGILGPEFAESAPHRNRPREIFAEDFRFLLGGPLATSSGTIENPDLPTPDRVPGLREWFEDLLRPRGPEVSERPAFAPRSRPNPFFPSASTLVVVFDAGETPRAAGFASISGTVHDASGRRVGSLDGALTGPSGVEFRWNGRDDAGRQVGSGVYFLRWVERPQAGVARVQVLR
jgi:hypothetical protein